MAKRYTVEEAQAEFAAIAADVARSGAPVEIEQPSGARLRLSVADPLAEPRYTTWEDILAFREQLSRERAGQPSITLEDCVGAVREGREERARQIDEALGLR